MAYQALVVRVFIASPGDVPDERDAIRSVVADWNAVHSLSRKIILEPVGWESHAVPRMGARPQAIINSQLLDEADILIAVFWTRLGTATGEYASGTVEEIEEHIKSGKPAMIYFSDAPVRMDSVDEKQFAALRSFRSLLLERGLTDSYDEQTQFRQKLTNQLAGLLNEAHFIETSCPSAEPQSDPAFVPSESDGLSNEGFSLIIEVCKGDGRVMMVRHLGGMYIQAGSTVLDTSTPRLCATWQGVVEKLLYEGYLAHVGHKGEIFEATDKAYKLFESLEL